MVGITILALAVSLIIQYVVASKFAEIAQMKGHTSNSYFWFTFLLGICGMLMVVALPNKNDITCTTSKNNTPVSTFLHNEPQNKTAVYTPTNNSKTTNKGNAPLNAEIVNGEKVCPKCGQTQKTDRKVCWFCGQPFSN